MKKMKVTYNSLRCVQSGFGNCCWSLPICEPGCMKLMRKYVKSPSTDWLVFFIIDIWKGVGTPKRGKMTESWRRSKYTQS